MPADSDARPRRRPATKVLHLLASADRRGAEVFGEELAGRLVGHGIDGDVLALSPARPGTRALDVDVLDGGLRRGLRELRRRAHGVDVVIGHGSTGLLGGVLATAGSRRRSIYRSIGDPAAWGAASTRSRLKVRAALRTADAVVSLWADAADTVGSAYGVPPVRRAVIPNAADPDRFRPASEDERAEARRALDLGDGPVVAMVGAFGPEKRVPLAIEAIGPMPGVTLLVVGDGPERPAVESAASAHPGSVRLLGSVDDTRLVYRAADAVISTSTTEGQSGVLIEALMSGLGVVATDVGGTPSVIDDRTCRLIPAVPSPAEVREAIDAVLDTSAEDRMAVRAAAVESFGFERVAELWADLILRVCADS